MRGLAIAWLVLAGPAIARADSLWCGTFGDERRPIHAASITEIPARPAVHVRIESALVDGVRDGRAGRRIDSALALDRCLIAGEVGRRAVWNLDLIVSPDGTVIGAQPRRVSARVVASAR